MPKISTVNPQLDQDKSAQLKNGLYRTHPCRKNHFCLKFATIH
ncbi:hypothetical protein A1D15_1922 [Lactiplantibacillus plantarum]|uniref:Uncharacterized protein n=1 Tax=Lactiplantibacillus plantarum TaxID=1590 RepID=A0A165N8I1_LACPN|nr:hypothetical protein FBR6_1913 [Lactiplantibacillus plantarum]KZU17604.1 hypothetical protein Nizo2484_3015 [Lactiplantibacillus plantarum]KZU29362.1 hypothetical protein Nizo2485_0699 [Lactiplantibacillus plantarum]KZU51980.1 hypothetical protein Nizo2802_1933 [Lactiplantibacillus plantarum]KZU81760.1 hypothetical protein Nizo3892_1457 [Lactiplantibacillus plantarum]